MRDRLKLILIFGVLTLAGCGGDHRSSRIMLLGLDGLDPRVVDLLMSEGKLPNLARIRQDGAYGKLQSMKPLLSPILWTTIATGKDPLQHGIADFTQTNSFTGEQYPVTSEMRRVNSLWSILSQSGRKVSVVGWWATWPAEPVNGQVVSDHTCYHFLFQQAAQPGPVDSATTYPADLFRRIAPMVRRPGELSLEEALPFVKVSQQEFRQPFHFDNDIGHFKWALATAESYRQIGLKLWSEENPDLLMAYFEATDSVSHLFGHLFRAQNLSGELAEQQAKFGNAVEEMYLYADRLVGDFMKVMDRSTSLIVLSDHGFDLGELYDDPSQTRDMRRVSERFHHPEGVVYLYGKDVRRHARLQEPHILDIAPTVLVLSQLPVASDMPGRVLTEALENRVPLQPVASYEDAGSSKAANSRDESVDPEILERLRSLGYLGGSGSSKNERNLAGIHFEAGRFQEAAEIYRQLIEEDPDNPALRTSLAGTLGAMGKYSEALEQLDKAIRLEPLNIEGHHNRGVLFERLGKVEEAVQEYRKAVRYNPRYQPSRAALLRLTGSAEAGPLLSGVQREAAKLAARAGLLARKGDYPAALELLDQAEALAPDLAIVYQYRSNVAFLMQDPHLAVESLEKALDLEPDNALYRNNLESLRRGPESTSE